jgi:nucleotide-binding universal stress UspA family protein
MASKPIVVGTDGSEASMRAVGWAAREAALRGAPLRIIAAAEAPPLMTSRAAPGEYEKVTDVLLEDRDRGLTAAAELAAKAAPGLLIDTDQVTGDPADAITDSDAGALMLVLGSHGAGAFTALVLGSVSRYAASHASGPVVIVRDETTPAHGLIGVGVGHLEHSAAALTFAFEEASARQASLVVIHAWHRPQTDISRAGEAVAPPSKQAAGADATRHLAGLLDEWKAKYPDVPVSQEVVHGHPGRALVGLSTRADLVVIGRHIRHHGRPGPGSARNALLSHAHGPVAVVPS